MTLRGMEVMEKTFMKELNDEVQSEYQCLDQDRKGSKEERISMKTGGKNEFIVE